MAKMRIEGSFVALITPFNADGTVDYGAFRTLLDWHAAQGTTAVLIMGSTGEVSMLSPEERREVVERTAAMRDGRMRFFYGCTGSSTAATIAYLRHAKAAGADGASWPRRPTSARPRTTSRRISPNAPMQSTCPSASTTTRRG
jgi:4-hydroxy-tetrahydrodipicolinate synthase